MSVSARHAAVEVAGEVGERLLAAPDVAAIEHPVHPEDGSPQGGVIPPVLENVYLHYALDLWFEREVKRHCRGRALIVRYADDLVCAFQYRSDAQAFMRVLPKRLAKFGLEVVPEKTRLLRFSRFHPARPRRFSFLGFEFSWELDRGGEPRLRRRTDPKRLRRSLHALTEWARSARHLPLRQFFGVLSSKLRGHYTYFGVPGNSRMLGAFSVEALRIMLKWLKRRGRKQRAAQRLALLPAAGGLRGACAADCSVASRSEPDTGMRSTMPCAVASIIEEPGAGVPHAGICAGAAG